MRTFVAATGVLVALIAPSVTLGDSSGVHSDPGSPAGRQYVLPVQGARAETGGGPSANPNAPPHPFGAGVTAPAASHSGPAASSTKSAPSSNAKSHKPAAGHKPAIAQLPRVPESAHQTGAASLAASKSSNSTGGSGWLALIGGGLLVLLVGGGGGLWLRRRLAGDGSGYLSASDSPARAGE